MLMEENDEEGAAELMGKRVKMGYKIVFLGNEDGHHSNCS